MLELRRRNAELLTKLLLPIADRTQLKLPQEDEEKKFNWYLYTVAFERNNQRQNQRQDDKRQNWCYCILQSSSPQDSVL